MLGFLAFFMLFCFFSVSLSPTQERQKQKKTHPSSQKTPFLTSRHFSKNTILAQCDTICVYKHAKSTMKMGRQWKTWTSFFLKLGPAFNLKPPKSWTSLTLQHAYIFVYMIFSHCRFLSVRSWFMMSKWVWSWWSKVEDASEQSTLVTLSW